MVQVLRQKMNILEHISLTFTGWVGTPYSIIVHSLLFVGIFSLYFFGITTDKILLILTTAVSLEAIYLSIFIQMSVNRATESLEDIQEDVIEEEQAHKVLIHIGQQMKVIQQELDILRKSGVLKTNGNGHRIHA